MKLGKHVSIAGGLDKAPVRAYNLNCNCLQIFSKNPRSWKGRKISETEYRKTKANLKKYKTNPLVIHDTYLINIASPKNKLWEKSLKTLKDEYIRAGKLGASYLVVHPGNHTGQGKKKGIKRISKALNLILSEVNNKVNLLLENVSGQGTAIGSNFEELYDIITNISRKEKIGICLDTCHALAAGYDMTGPQKIELMLDQFDKIIGLEDLKVIHINDSKHPCGTNKDEHAHIGKGYLGLKNFEYLINHPQLKKIPFILETPKFKGEDNDVKTLLALRKD